MTQNGLDVNDIKSYAYAIVASINEHIAKYNRILFPDLCAYIECQFHILKTIGYSAISLKKIPIGSYGTYNYVSSQNVFKCRME